MILFCGTVAALDQIEIARHVVAGVPYAALAAIVAVVLVAVAVGEIQLMRGRWQATLDPHDHEQHESKPRLTMASTCATGCSKRQRRTFRLNQRNRPSARTLAVKAQDRLSTSGEAVGMARRRKRRAPAATRRLHLAGPSGAAPRPRCLAPRQPQAQ